MYYHCTYFYKLFEFFLYTSIYIKFILIIVNIIWQPQCMTMSAVKCRLSVRGKKWVSYIESFESALDPLPIK